MPISSDMTGSPWHAERMHRAEGDDRRHKCYCTNYQSFNDQCKYYYEKCRGTAHCEKYVDCRKAQSDSSSEQSEQYNHFSGEENKKEVSFSSVIKKGTKVRHTIFGVGVVVSINSEDKASILFEGEVSPKTLCLKTLLQNKLLSIIE